MKTSHSHLMLATALVAGLAVAAPLAVGQARAEDSATRPTDPGFKSNGQINPGGTLQAPSQATEIIKIPTPEEVRAAKMTPISTQPSAGAAPAAPAAAQAAPAAAQAVSSPPPAATTGAASTSEKAGAEPAASIASSATPPAVAGPPPSGPIGSVGETIPAKFSQRNDILDHVPTMALPLTLSDQERQQIFQAVMADKSQSATDADALAPASQLSTDQALNGMHRLPASVGGIAGVKSLDYVKGKNKVLLVEPATRTVVAQITA